MLLPMTRRLPMLALLVLFVVGCDNSSSTSSGGATAPPGGGTVVPILQPYHGAWRFSLPKTLARWQADGVPAAEIAQAKTLAQQFPLHPDMVITNDTAILSPQPLEGEYKFFALHPHNPWTCGKAWHHEDRHDPGDMSKCFVRLEVKDSDLHLSLRDDENPANPNDPDVATTPTLAGSATNCGADAAPDPPWSAWRTYVFERSK
jgi:hypothetical protein